MHSTYSGNIIAAAVQPCSLLTHHIQSIEAVFGVRTSSGVSPSCTARVFTKYGKRKRKLVANLFEGDSDGPFHFSSFLTLSEEHDGKLKFASDNGKSTH